LIYRIRFPHRINTQTQALWASGIAIPEDEPGVDREALSVNRSS